MLSSVRCSLAPAGGDAARVFITEREGVGEGGGVGVVWDTEGGRGKARISHVIERKHESILEGVQSTMAYTSLPAYTLMSRSSFSVDDGEQESESAREQ